MVELADEIDAVVKELEDAIARKAPHGGACNRCGACCMVSVCVLGYHVLKYTELGRCPALEQEGDEYLCGIIVHPERYTDRTMDAELREAALLLIGHDMGCDAAFPGETRNTTYTNAIELDGKRAIKREAFNKARRLWDAT